MTIDSQLSTTEPQNKNKLSKQLEQEQDHRNGITWRVISREVSGGVGWGERGKRYRE